jgi:hypothetical protein
MYQISIRVAWLGYYPEDARQGRKWAQELLSRGQPAAIL